jgi:hypothetical protein
MHRAEHAIDLKAHIARLGLDYRVRRTWSSPGY